MSSEGIPTLLKSLFTHFFIRLSFIFYSKGIKTNQEWKQKWNLCFEVIAINNTDSLFTEI